MSSDKEESVLKAVQLLWVNLIMDTFAALALATDPPTPSILDRKPEPKSAPLITVNMWKMIIGQSIFQLIVTFILYFGGSSFLSYHTQRERDQLQTLVFNTFVWMQIFNQYNNRRLDNKLNILEGVHRNKFFIVIQFIIVGGQIIIIEFGGAAFSTKKLNKAQWGYSVVLGFLSVPVAILLRLISDDWIRRCIPSWFVRKAAPKVLVSDEERQFEWNPALESIREELTFMKMLRGGRLNVLKYKLQHPVETLLPRSLSRDGSTRSRSRTNSIPQTPTNEQSDAASGQPPRTPDSRRSPGRRPRSRSGSAFGPAAAMMATGIVAGSIAGWSPIGPANQLSEEDSRFSQAGRSQLEGEEGVEVHPDTSKDDPVITKESEASGGPPSQVPGIRPAPAKSKLSSLAPVQPAK